MYKKILIIIICLLCCACFQKEETSPFKEEWEKYNGKYLKLELENTNIIKLSTTSEINKVIEKGTGVIFIGNPKNNLSRRAISILLEVANNTDLEKIYYLDNYDEINNIQSIENIKIPLVLFVVEGKIVNYRVGTVEDKEELTDDETIELYNFYLEGVHQVLQDACDERC